MFAGAAEPVVVEAVVAAAPADDPLIEEEVSGTEILEEEGVEAGVDVTTWLLLPVGVVLVVLIGNTASPIAEVDTHFELDGAGCGAGVDGCPWKNVEEP
jgi:hypothetical protein